MRAAWNHSPLPSGTVPDTVQSPKLSSHFSHMQEGYRFSIQTSTGPVIVLQLPGAKPQPSKSSISLSLVRNKDGNWFLMSYTLQSPSGGWGWLWKRGWVPHHWAAHTGKQVIVNTTEQRYCQQKGGKRAGAWPGEMPDPKGIINGRDIWCICSDG